MENKIRMAMVGGGTGSFIGPVHRMAAALDNRIELVAGAFSSNPAVTKATGRDLGLDAARCYDSWQEMIRREAALPKNQKAHFIAVVTPNHLHYAPVMEALNSGFHVVCDKPLGITSEEAQKVLESARKNNRLFCITHNYTGYPMVKLAKELVASGEIGKVRKVVAEYFQGWLATQEEKKGNRQAVWRSKPETAGIAGAMADIGTHAFQLSEYVSGRQVSEVCADLSSAFPDRLLDDDGSVLLRFQNNIKGTILVSQVATGEENNFSLRVYGEKGSIAWEQMNPNSLLFRPIDGPMKTFRTAFNLPSGLNSAALHSRIPAGHPEGFIEAFANIYRNFAMAVEAIENGKLPDKSLDFPGPEDALRGMRFLEAVVHSSKNGTTWTAI